MITANIHIYFCFSYISWSVKGYNPLTNLKRGRFYGSVAQCISSVFQQRQLKMRALTKRMEELLNLKASVRPNKQPAWGQGHTLNVTVTSKNLHLKQSETDNCHTLSKSWKTVGRHARKEKHFLKSMRLEQPFVLFYRIFLTSIHGSDAKIC